MATLDDSAHSKVAMDVEPGSNGYHGKPGKQVEEVPINLDEEAEGGESQGSFPPFAFVLPARAPPRQLPSLQSA